MTTCPACASPGLDAFYAQPAVPVNSLLLLATPEEAAAFPTAPLTLALCAACGFVTNEAFEPAMTKYSADYEETQGFSPRFREFAAELAADWVARYDLAGKHVLEIGCGKGEFLAEMVRAGAGRGTGYDPVWKPGRTDEALSDRLDFVADNFGLGQVGIEADAVVCRHTLEHIPAVESFLRDLATVLCGQPDTVLLFEVPDVQRVLDEVAFWDVFYEHCSYFSAGSLARLFRRCGFEVLALRRVFDDQYLVVEARLARSAEVVEPTGVEDDLARLVSAAERFETEITATKQRWRDEIEGVRAAGGTVVLWGSGSKSVSFLTTVGITDEVEHVVDINPNKHDTYNAGTGQRIIAPALLQELRPAMVVVMNPVYVPEITADIVALGVETRVVAL